jgi:hypothetical protein
MIVSVLKTNPYSSFVKKERFMAFSDLSPCRLPGVDLLEINFRDAWSPTTSPPW